MRGDAERAKQRRGFRIGDRMPHARQADAIGDLVGREIGVERGLAGACERHAIARPHRLSAVAQEGGDRLARRDGGLFEARGDAGCAADQFGKAARSRRRDHGRPLAEAVDQGPIVPAPGDEAGLRFL
jgi:hypothetical protein